MGNHYNCIYMYTNLINGKRYVGKAKDFNKRYKEHLKYDEQLIDKKINEYGIENFKVEILIENVEDNDKLNEYEKFFIKRKRSHVSYGTGYNKTWGGDGGDTLSGMTEEQRKECSRKKSKAMKGKPSPHKGKKFKPLSKEHKRKVSESRKGNKHPQARSVICLETKQSFNTIKEAQEWLGKGNIKQHLKGRAKSAGKHPITKQPLHWQYYEDYLKLQEEQSNKTQDLVTEVA